MKRRLLWFLSGFLVLILVAIPGIALAASYYISITVTNQSAGSDYDCLPIIKSINNTKLVELGYIDNSGNDTRVTYAGTDLKHMVANDKVAFVAPDVNKGITYNYNYTMGNEPIGFFSIIPGYNGYITVPDNAPMEMGDNFDIELKGWVDTSAGSDKNLIHKASAFKLYISSEGAIRATVNPGGTETSVTAAEVPSGEHRVKVATDDTTLRIYVDGVMKDSDTLAAGVVDNGNSWVLIENNVMPYMDYFKISTEG
ncbi:hypothetical protein ES703_11516 [subsurface metagenome]